MLLCVLMHSNVNVNFEAMEEKYLEILRHYVNPNDCKTVIQMLLNLHDVVGRSEQLVDFLKWVGDGYDFENNAENIVKEYIDEGN